MKDVRVNLCDAAMVAYIDKEGVRTIIPLVKTDSGWGDVGCYLKLGASKSDKAFATVFPTPYRWEIPDSIKTAIRKEQREQGRAAQGGGERAKARGRAG